MNITLGLPTLELAQSDLVRLVCNEIDHLLTLSCLYIKIKGGAKLYMVIFYTGSINLEFYEHSFRFTYPRIGSK